MVRLLINLVFFKAGWFTCVLGAAHGLPLLGPAVVAIVVAFHLIRAEFRAREAVLIALVGVTGTVVDSLQMRAGSMNFAPEGTSQVLIPLWMIALWLNFAPLLNVSLRWLHGRYVLCALFGAVGGPLSYYAGASIGALSLNENTLQALILIGVEWAVSLPTIIWFAQTLSAPRPAAVVLESSSS